LRAVLTVQVVTDRSLEQALADALHSVQMLLVLDNCEHLLNACAALVALLLRECPTLHILATSREPIGIPGEVIWNLSPLEVPEARGSVSFAEIERSPAVRLFVGPARRSGRSSSAATTSMPSPRSVDAWTASLWPSSWPRLASTSSPRRSWPDVWTDVSLLSGGNRAALPRQQTLGATIDWSYQFLTLTQQRVFERLAVLANGWTFDAADAICAGDGLAAEGVLDAVLQLIRRSLVMRIDVRHGSARYGLLETLRRYAWEKLAAGWLIACMPPPTACSPPAPIFRPTPTANHRLAFRCGRSRVPQ
jgi:non-specific serine/threonine protein kinase